MTISQPFWWVDAVRTVARHNPQGGTRFVGLGASLEPRRIYSTRMHVLYNHLIHPAGDITHG